MSADQRAFYELRYGADLGHVRIHADPVAAREARTQRAKAYTQGADIVFARERYAPGTAAGERLLAHELAHAVQQTAPPQARSPVARRTAAPVVSRAVDDWLSGSVDLRAWTYTRLIDEIDEISQYLERQTSSSPETGRLDEALAQLRAEANRRDSDAAGPPRERGRRSGGRRRRPEAAADSPTLPARYPRVLTEMSSVVYENPAEMREEYDLIMQWLARPEISDNERRILNTERDNLAPQFNLDRQRVVTERHTARVRTALAPTDTTAVDALQRLAEIIQGIVDDSANPTLSYIYDAGERVTISREQAEHLRGEFSRRLRDASRSIDGRAVYYWERYGSQLAINRDSPIIAGITGWLADVEDPSEELAGRYFHVRSRIRVLQRHLEGGRLVDAARILPEVERFGQEIGDLSRAFYEGHIEGADIAIRRLEFTRDASFAIAGSIATVIAAPVVAGAVGVGGLGLTGTGATIATMAGTGTVVGTGMAGLRGTAAVAGTGLAGGSAAEMRDAFFSEAVRGFREGFLTGAGGAAARSLGLALSASGSVAIQVAGRVGGEMLINSTTAMADVLLQYDAERMAHEGLTRAQVNQMAVRAGLVAAVAAIPGALLGGANNPVVRNLVAPLTAGATAFLAARANGATTETALMQAGAAVASNLALSRATHSPDADAELVARGREMGASARSTVDSFGRTVRSYSAAVMIGTADALPPVRSGYGGTSMAMDLGTGPSARMTESATPHIESPDMAGGTTATAAPRPDTEHVDTTAAPAAAPHTETDTPVADDAVSTPRPATAESSTDETVAAPATTTRAGDADADFDRHFDAALSPDAQFEVGEVRTRGGEGRPDHTSVEAALSPVRRLAASRLIGQRLGTLLRQAWNNTINARETADLATIAAHWNAGRHDEARTLARSAFNRHRGRFWRAVRRDPALRAVFTDAGMVFPSGRGAPVYVDPDTGDMVDRMTIEHQTRLADDPTLALDAGNLQTVLGYENSVDLEAIRRSSP